MWPSFSTSGMKVIFLVEIPKYILFYVNRSAEFECPILWNYQLIIL